MTEKTLAEQHPGGCYIALNGQITRKSAQEIVSMCAQAWQKGFEEVTLCMNSPGGFLEHAYYAYNMLEALPLTFTTYNTSAVQSAANVLFVVGERRFACPGSTFFFHQTSFQQVAGQQVTEAFAKERLKSIQLEDTRSAEIVANKTPQTVESVRSWQAGQLLMSAPEALANGLIHGVQPLVVPKDALFSQIILQE